MPAPGRINGKALTNHLRTLAAQVTTDHFNEVTGDVITREEALAQLLWRQALGWTEEVTDDSGNKKQVKHPPIGWAQQFMWERMEGKAPISMPENDGGMKAADKVRALAKDRLNSKAMAIAGVKGPPQYKPKS